MIFLKSIVRALPCLKCHSSCKIDKVVKHLVRFRSLVAVHSTPKQITIADDFSITRKRSVLQSNNVAFPKPHVIAPANEHTHAIIFIHGRGSNGEELAEELSEGRTSTGLSLQEGVQMRGCKWIFPSAHERYPTVFQDTLTEWFDIYSLTDTDAEQERQIDGLRESVEHIRNIIEKEIQLIPINNIILAGISQGFAVASHVLLSSEYRLGGFIGLCGWIPFQNELRSVIRGMTSLGELFQTRIGLDSSATSAITEVPVFIGHGRGDDVVDFEHGKDACDMMRRLGMNVEFHAYEDSEHCIAEPEGYDDLATFLLRCL